ncbi:MAG TPA: hypothetical protein VIJ12_01675 [Candidatus Baltobacteraceae bacterium]
MLKYLVSALLVASIAFPLAARADLQEVMIKNHTDKSAWITIYTANNLFESWEITGMAFCLRPGVWQHVGLAKPKREIKVRAEVKSGPNCTGNNLVDTYDERKGLNQYNITAGLYPNGSRYNLWF